MSDHRCSTLEAAMLRCRDHGLRCGDITIEQDTKGAGHYGLVFEHDGRLRMTYINFCPWDGAPLRDDPSQDGPWTGPWHGKPDAPNPMGSAADDEEPEGPFIAINTAHAAARPDPDGGADVTEDEWFRFQRAMDEQ